MKISALPVHVRTARQVAVAIGRRNGMTEDVLQDVRLAVGEAAGLTVNLHEQMAPGAPVRLSFRDDDGLTVEVQGSVALPEAAGMAAAGVLNEVSSSNGDLEPLSPDAVLAVLSEITSEVKITTGASGSRLSLYWSRSYRQS